MIGTAISFGLLAVIIWAVVDCFASRKVALWTAFGLGAAISGLSILITGRIDYLVLIEFVFIGGFILFSLFKDDDYYFRLAPAILGVLLAVVIGVLTIGFDRPVLAEMAEKYGFVRLMESIHPNVGAGELFSAACVTIGKQIPFWLVLHSVLIYYAARYWGKWWWVGIKTVGGWIILFMAAAVALITMAISSFL